MGFLAFECPKGVSLNIISGLQPNVQFLRENYFKKRPIHKRQNEVIPYNDCLYRNLYHYKYLALLDLDEIIVPKMAENWPKLLYFLERLTSKVASFNFKNAYFMDSMSPAKKIVPKQFHILDHVMRSRNYSLHIKSFHSTSKKKEIENRSLITHANRHAKTFSDEVLTVHNHYPISCIHGYCHKYLFRKLGVQSKLRKSPRAKPECSKCIIAKGRGKFCGNFRQIWSFTSLC